jgi:hypothetical protein
MAEVSLELRRQIHRLKQSMRVRRPDAPWRMEDDGQEETDQAAGEGAQGKAESPWNGVDIGVELDFTGSPLTPGDLERASKLIAEQYSQPTQMFVGPSLLQSLIPTMLTEQVLKDAAAKVSHQFPITKPINFPIQSSASDFGFDPNKLIPAKIEIMQGRSINVHDFEEMCKIADQDPIRAADVFAGIMPGERKKET